MPRFRHDNSIPPTLVVLSLALFLLVKVPSISSFLRPPQNRAFKRPSLMGSWDALSPESLVSAPCLIEQTLCEANDDLPRLAAHKEYAVSILDAWRDEEEGSDWDVEWSSTTYQAKGETNTQLFGHWIRARDPSEQSSRAVILFHTAAGPHDIFLIWKAASLAHCCNVSVLIADVLSDELGWGWDSDRSHYQKVREQLREDGVFAGRVDAALDEVERLGLECIGAFGFCLGGLSILELVVSSRCPPALVTFHGVFTERPSLPADLSTVPRSELLICHGVDDPFVPSSDVEGALALAQDLRHKASLLQLKAKHGFSNPAQAHNPNEAFAYDHEAAQKSWRQAVALVQRVMENSS